MKTIKNILAGLAMLVSVSVSAQEVPGPTVGPAIDYSTAVFIVPGITTTNVAAAFQKNIPVGRLGVAFQIEIAGTNATTTTNALITFEGTVGALTGGTFWIDSPATALPAFSVPQNGTGPYTVFTNMQATSPNLNGIRYLRVKSIQNTNTASIFITNFVYSVRQ